ncbi:MAG: hypothetical protein KatS3mg063_0541 [Tepidiforma sp.]|uniref:hypothetical protein n=1 Tax=Tepidiforma sp. TaxID=2682230 RepID=UPI0021DF0C42|nr:hypothetical protein [Tepidiforma sp.]GIW14688.1 MAG: hypothetical protein KatS3mg063_0541 [Tepidiforma sp.]
MARARRPLTGDLRDRRVGRVGVGVFVGVVVGCSSASRSGVGVVVAVPVGGVVGVAAASA